MKYSLAIAALIGLISFEQVQQVRASDIQTPDAEDDSLVALGEQDDAETQNDQMEASEDEEDQDEQSINESDKESE